MAVQNALYDLTLLGRAALPGLAGDVVVAVAAAALGAVQLREPGVSRLQPHTHRQGQGRQLIVEGEGTTERITGASMSRPT